MLLFYAVLLQGLLLDVQDRLLPATLDMQRVAVRCSRSSSS